MRQAGRWRRCCRVGLLGPLAAWLAAAACRGPAGRCWLPCAGCAAGVLSATPLLPAMAVPSAGFDLARNGCWRAGAAAACRLSACSVAAGVWYCKDGVLHTFWWQPSCVCSAPAAQVGMLWGLAVLLCSAFAAGGRLQVCRQSWSAPGVSCNRQAVQTGGGRPPAAALVLCVLLFWSRFSRPAEAPVLELWLSDTSGSTSRPP